LLVQCACQRRIACQPPQLIEKRGPFFMRVFGVRRASTLLSTSVGILSVSRFEIYDVVKLDSYFKRRPRNSPSKRRSAEVKAQGALTRFIMDLTTTRTGQYRCQIGTQKIGSLYRRDFFSRNDHSD
jgi:hypothetical protein